MHTVLAQHASPTDRFPSAGRRPPTVLAPDTADVFAPRRALRSTGRGHSLGDWLRFLGRLDAAPSTTRCSRLPDAALPEPRRTGAGPRTPHAAAAARSPGRATPPGATSLRQIAAAVRPPRPPAARAGLDTPRRDAAGDASKAWPSACCTPNSTATTPPCCPTSPPPCRCCGLRWRRASRRSHRRARRARRLPLLRLPARRQRRQARRRSRRPALPALRAVQHRMEPRARQVRRLRRHRRHRLPQLEAEARPAIRRRARRNLRQLQELPQDRLPGEGARRPRRRRPRHPRPRHPGQRSRLRPGRAATSCYPGAGT